MTPRTPALIASMCVAFSAFSCAPATEKRQPQTPEGEDLRFTLGGFREGHPDEGEVGGVCAPDSTRTVLNCDIYNGLEGWTVTEATFAITRYPYHRNDTRYYAEHVFIEPLKTKRVSIRLGLELPPDTQFKNNRGRPIGRPESHWGWSIFAAKGYGNR